MLRLSEPEAAFLGASPPVPRGHECSCAALQPSFEPRRLGRLLRLQERYPTGRALWRCDLHGFPSTAAEKKSHRGLATSARSSGFRPCLLGWHQWRPSASWPDRTEDLPHAGPAVAEP